MELTFSKVATLTIEDRQSIGVAGWQNQGYAWYIVPRTYSEKVGLIEWRNQFFFLNVVELLEK